MSETDKQRSFEARMFATLDQVRAEQRTQGAQLVGLTVMVALLAVGMYVVGRIAAEGVS